MNNNPTEKESQQQLKIESLELINEGLILNNHYLKTTSQKIQENNKKLALIGNNIYASNEELKNIRDALLKYNESLKDSSIALEKYNESIKELSYKLLDKNNNLEEIGNKLLQENKNLEDLGKGLLSYNTTLETSTETLRQINETLKEKENSTNGENGSLQQLFENKTEELNKLINKLDKAYKLQEESNKYKNYFTNTMSYELQKPINAIIGFSKLLKDNVYGELNEKQTHYTNLILNNSESLLNNINALYDITLIDKDKIDFNPDLCFINQLIEELICFINYKFLDKKISLIFKNNPDIEYIQADERKIKQIIIILLDNALKYTYDSGTVEISLEKISDDSIKISIKDTGIGISEENIDKVFDDFYSGTHNDENIKKGIGIGLSLFKRLVELHGGTFGVESIVKKGSTFWFTLPTSL